MTPFYERDGITVYCGDCLDVMPQLEESFDAIIADLPYGTTVCSWDVIIPFKPLWEQYKRLAEGAVVLFGSQPFTSKLVMSNIEWYRYDWIWYKSHSSRYMKAKTMPMLKHDHISVFYKSLPVYNPQMKKGIPKMSRVGKPVRERKTNGRTQDSKTLLICENVKTDLYYPHSVLEFDCGARADMIHPTQKPVALLAYLIRTYTNPGNIVLDNTMGSGTTLVAARNAGRRAVGIEVSEKYCQIAVERLRQRSMFQVIEMPESKKSEQAKMSL